MTTDEMTPLERAHRAVREAWGDHHHTNDGGVFYAPPVRDGGATDALIRLAVPTAVHAVLDRDEISQALRDADADYQAREQRTDAGDASMEPGDWWDFMADAVIAHLTGGAA